MFQFDASVIEAYDVFNSARHASQRCEPRRAILFLEANTMSDGIKPAKTLEEQLSIFKGRGLIIDDDDWVISVLQRISYYRLTGYLIEYKVDDDTYRSGTSFRLIYETYQFDARFRSMFLAVLESIEISIRTKITYYLAHVLGPMGYRESVHFAHQGSVNSRDKNLDFFV